MVLKDKDLQYYIQQLILRGIKYYWIDVESKINLFSFLPYFSFHSINH